jgi:hypothetical protein
MRSVSVTDRWGADLESVGKVSPPRVSPASRLLAGRVNRELFRWTGLPGSLFSQSTATIRVDGHRHGGR